MEPITITMRDFRRVAYCSRGVREFFERHGLNWSDFLRNGIQSDILAATGDAMALKAIEVARERR